MFYSGVRNAKNLKGEIPSTSRMVYCFTEVLEDSKNINR